MAKKRNCRRNEQERSDHERAVSLRKMPDDQLIKHFKKHYDAGFDAGRIGIKTLEQETSDKIMQVISGIKGIGAATLAKIQSAIDGNASHA